MTKYLEEKVSDWFIFGHREGNPDAVDVCDVDGDVIVGIPREAALSIINQHNRVLAMLSFAYSRLDVRGRAMLLDMADKARLQRPYDHTRRLTK